MRAEELIKHLEMVGTAGCENLLRKLLAAKNTALVSEEIIFTPETLLSSGIYQVYLEVKNPTRDVFGGEGLDKKAARDAAAHQALKYLYCKNVS